MPEPAMSTDSVLSRLFRGIVGMGKGSGMALMFLFTCIIGLIISLGGYLINDVRNIEEDIPDYDVVVNN